MTKLDANIDKLEASNVTAQVEIVAIRTVDEIAAAMSATLFLLRVNRESREVATGGLARLNLLTDGVPPLFFNQAIDTLWLANYTTRRALNPRGPHQALWLSGPKFKKVAIPLKTWIEMNNSIDHKLLDYS
ncbi:uncharacterized protein PAC_19051 [Phialocephala subalpina]|uniref:Uncharacterized protein n=1 Tax=Phialocephala subalpina TaxID=576137 RepID=A0A1L7XVT5_9HELO|nr:uncharacterized protein PAC_19051 [Phialocephala subalpina]